MQQRLRHSEKRSYKAKRQQFRDRKMLQVPMSSSAGDDDSAAAAAMKRMRDNFNRHNNNNENCNGDDGDDGNDDGNENNDINRGDNGNNNNYSVIGDNDEDANDGISNVDVRRNNSSLLGYDEDDITSSGFQMADERFSTTTTNNSNIINRNSSNAVVHGSDANVPTPKNALSAAAAGGGSSSSLEFDGRQRSKSPGSNNGNNNNDNESTNLFHSMSGSSCTSHSESVANNSNHNNNHSNNDGSHKNFDSTIESTDLASPTFDRGQSQPTPFGATCATPVPGFNMQRSLSDTYFPSSASVMGGRTTSFSSAFGTSISAAASSTVIGGDVGGFSRRTPSVGGNVTHIYDSTSDTHPIISQNRKIPQSVVDSRVKWLQDVGDRLKGAFKKVPPPLTTDVKVAFREVLAEILLRKRINGVLLSEPEMRERLRRREEIMNEFISRLMQKTTMKRKDVEDALREYEEIYELFENYRTFKNSVKPSEEFMERIEALTAFDLIDREQSFRKDSLEKEWSKCDFCKWKIKAAAAAASKKAIPKPVNLNSSGRGNVKLNSGNNKIGNSSAVVESNISRSGSTVGKPPLFPEGEGRASSTTPVLQSSSAASTPARNKAEGGGGGPSSPGRVSSTRGRKKSGAGLSPTSSGSGGGSSNIHPSLHGSFSLPPPLDLGQGHCSTTSTSNSGSRGKNGESDQLPQRSPADSVTTTTTTTKSPSVLSTASSPSASAAPPTRQLTLSSPSHQQQQQSKNSGNTGGGVLQAPPMSPSTPPVPTPGINRPKFASGGPPAVVPNSGGSTTSIIQRSPSKNNSMNNKVRDYSPRSSPNLRPMPAAAAGGGGGAEGGEHVFNRSGSSSSIANSPNILKQVQQQQQQQPQQQLHSHHHVHPPTHCACWEGFELKIMLQIVQRVSNRVSQSLRMSRRLSEKHQNQLRSLGLLSLLDDARTPQLMAAPFFAMMCCLRRVVASDRKMFAAAARGGSNTAAANLNSNSRHPPLARESSQVLYTLASSEAVRKKLKKDVLTIHERFDILELASEYLRNSTTQPNREARIVNPKDKECWWSRELYDEFSKKMLEIFTAIVGIVLNDVRQSAEREYAIADWRSRSIDLIYTFRGSLRRNSAKFFCEGLVAICRIVIRTATTQLEVASSTSISSAVTECTKAKNLAQKVLESFGAACIYAFDDYKSIFEVLRNEKYKLVEFNSNNSNFRLPPDLAVFVSSEIFSAETAYAAAKERDERRMKKKRREDESAVNSSNIWRYRSKSVEKGSVSTGKNEGDLPPQGDNSCCWSPNSERGTFKRTTSDEGGGGGGESGGDSGSESEDNQPSTYNESIVTKMLCGMDVPAVADTGSSFHIIVIKLPPPTVAADVDQESLQPHSVHLRRRNKNRLREQQQGSISPTKAGRNRGRDSGNSPWSADSFSPTGRRDDKDGGNGGGDDGDDDDDENSDDSDGEDDDVLDDVGQGSNNKNNSRGKGRRGKKRGGRGGAEHHHHQQQHQQHHNHFLGENETKGSNKRTTGRHKGKGVSGNRNGESTPTQRRNSEVGGGKGSKSRRHSGGDKDEIDNRGESSTRDRGKSAGSHSNFFEGESPRKSFGGGNTSRSLGDDNNNNSNDGSSSHRSAPALTAAERKNHLRDLQQRKKDLRRSGKKDSKRSALDEFGYSLTDQAWRYPDQQEESGLDSLENTTGSAGGIAAPAVLAAALAGLNRSHSEDPRRRNSLGNDSSDGGGGGGGGGPRRGNSCFNLREEYLRDSMDDDDLPAHFRLISGSGGGDKFFSPFSTPPRKNSTASVSTTGGGGGGGGGGGSGGDGGGGGRGHGGHGHGGGGGGKPKPVLTARDLWNGEVYSLEGSEDDGAILFQYRKFFEGCLVVIASKQHTLVGRVKEVVKSTLEEHLVTVRNNSSPIPILSARLHRVNVELETMAEVVLLRAEREVTALNALTMNCPMFSFPVYSASASAQTTPLPSAPQSPKGAGGFGDPSTARGEISPGSTATTHSSSAAAALLFLQQRTPLVAPAGTSSSGSSVPEFFLDPTARIAIQQQQQQQQFLTSYDTSALIVHRLLILALKLQKLRGPKSERINDDHWKAAEERQCDTKAWNCKQLEISLDWLKLVEQGGERTAWFLQEEWKRVQGILRDTMSLLSQEQYQQVQTILHNVFSSLERAVKDANSRGTSLRPAKLFRSSSSSTNYNNSSVGGGAGGGADSVVTATGQLARNASSTSLSSPYPGFISPMSPQFPLPSSSSVQPSRGGGGGGGAFSRSDLGDEWAAVEQQTTIMPTSPPPKRTTIAELEAKRQEIAVQNRLAGKVDTSRRMVMNVLPLRDADDRPIHLVLGKFIAVGGKGRVYESNAMGAKWAVKVIMAPNEEDVRRIEKEISILTALGAHPNIVWYFGQAVFDREMHLVMEFCNKGSLANIIASNPSEQPLDWYRVQQFSRQLFSALSYIHSLQPPIIHRDVKPDNCLISGDSEQLKLADFGESLFASPQSLPKTLFAGTMGLIAPELFESTIQSPDVVVDLPKVDVWSGACTMLAMRRCVSQYIGKNQTEHFQMFRKMIKGPANERKDPFPPPFPKDNCPPEFLQFLRSCLEIKPQDRATAASMMNHAFLKMSFERQLKSFFFVPPPPASTSASTPAMAVPMTPINNNNNNNNGMKK